jgi:hypothetical protein
MDFIIKDLLVTILPSRPAFKDDACGNCSGLTDRCIGCSEGPSRDLTGDMLTPLINPASPQELARLKNQLSEALAAVEAKEKSLITAMQPQTMQEVEILQQYLSGAIDYLRSRREEMERIG